jgi:coniferyl-aldehyde dehydrogenase
MTSRTPLKSARAASPDLGPTEPQSILEAQRRDYLGAGPPSAAVRRDRVDRLILLLTENADNFAQALNSDFGNRPTPASLLSDVAGPLPDLLMARKRLQSWMRPETIRGPGLLGLPTIVEKRPLGVVGIIGPWNFPVGLVVQPAASALAAGNRVMVKFSEVTPRTAEVFAAAAGQYFAPEELAVVTGGPEVGAQFGSLPFDHLFFTGSPGVGALVARAAGANLVPVTLELGGKNPAVVGPTADIATSAKRIMSARLANGGQLCLCPDYAFVPAGAIDDFVSAAMQVATQAVSDGNADGLVSIVNDRNFDRVTALIDDARRRGAQVETAPIAPDRTRRRIPPTVLLGVTDEMQIAHDEVFGPVLSVLTYDDIDHVVSYVNSRPSPLAAYWFGPKDRSFDKFRHRVTSGGVTVNDFAAHCSIMSAPFGGVGHSGSGAYHGKTGFDTFSHHRTITTSRLPVGLGALLAPPYSPILTGGIRAYIRAEHWRAARRLKRAAHTRKKESPAVVS